jgi:Pyridoxamine 5'-phosphate oxidase
VYNVGVNAIGDSAAPYRTPEERRRVVTERFSADRDCWLVTSHPTDGPHVIPLSFAASGAVVLLATASARPAVKNLRADPRAAFVLGGYGDAIRAFGGCTILPWACVERELRDRYVTKAGWNPDLAGPEFVGVLFHMQEVLCSRSPPEEADRIVWTSERPTPW